MRGATQTILTFMIQHLLHDHFVYKEEEKNQKQFGNFSETRSFETS